MLLPCNPPVSAENFHPRAQIHPDTKLPLPSDVSIVFKCWLLVSDAHTNASNPNVLHPGPQKNLSHRFLFIGHFSPSISRRWQAGEKSCARMCTHTPLCHSLSHKCTGRKSFLPQADWGIHRKCSIWVWVNGKGSRKLDAVLILFTAKTVWFAVGFASVLLLLLR